MVGKGANSSVNLCNIDHDLSRVQDQGVVQLDPTSASFIGFGMPLFFKTIKIKVIQEIQAV